jgi:hypothetical protein
VELRSALPHDLHAALLRVGEGVIPPDAADPLDFLGFYSISR